MSRMKRCHAIVMITGTSVGTGILGLPIATSQAGFLPTIMAFILAWIFMTTAALYILDVKMQFKSHYNLSSLIKLTLGRFGHYTSSTMVILLLYALLCSYMMTGSAWFCLLIGTKSFFSPNEITLLFVFIFGLLILFKERILYRINNILGIGLGIAFIITIGLSLWPVDLDLIQHVDLPAILPSLPLLLTTFGFSIVVPSVTEYLDYDARATKLAIIIGSLIAFAVYLIWEWVILGHIPLYGPKGLLILNKLGDNGTGVITAFATITQNPWVKISGQLFAILAAITSFFGVSLALLHCLNDLIPFKPHQPKQFSLILLTFIPPLAITLLYPKAFIEILSFAGLGVAILLGLLPAMMIAKTRYSSWQTPRSSQQKNRLSLTSFILHPKTLWITVTALFFIFVMIQECCNLLR